MYYVNVALWGALHLLKAKLSNLALFQRQDTLCAVHVSLCTRVRIFMLTQGIFVPELLSSKSVFKGQIQSDRGKLEYLEPS